MQIHKKTKSYAILVLVSIILIMSSGIYVSATSTSVISENFDALPFVPGYNVPISGTGKWITYTSGNVTAMAETSGNSIKLTTNNNSGSASDIRLLSPSDKPLTVPSSGFVVVEASMKYAGLSASSVAGMTLRFTQGSNTYSNFVGFKTVSTGNNYFKAQNGKSVATYTDLASYNTNQWYEFKIIINPATSTYEVYIDGIKANTNPLQLTWTSTTSVLAASNPYPNATIAGGSLQFQLYNVASTLSNNMWVDNVKLYTADTPTLISCIPANTAQKVDVNSNIVLTFNNDMDSSTLNSANIAINNEAGNPVSVTPSYSNKILKLSGNLEYGRDYTITFANVKDFYGQLLTASPITFTTAFIPQVSGIVDGVKYGKPVTPDWAIPAGLTIDASLSKDNATPAPYVKGTAITEPGAYQLVLTAVRTLQNDSESKTINFIITQPMPPEATSVKVQGNAYEGQKLTATYTYSDINGDNETQSAYRWLRADKIDGDYAVIPGMEGTTTANEGSTYTITENDIGKFLKFEVTPKSDASPMVGTTVTSAPLTGPDAPKVSNVRIMGASQIGSEISGMYDYFDINGDAEFGSVCRWVRADKIDGVYSPINNTLGNAYTITADDIDKFIKFEITPKNQQIPTIGSAVLSNAFLAPAKPVANNIRINGTIKTENTISGEYDYSDANRDMEQNSKYRWLMANSINGDYIEVGTGISYNIAAGDAGKYIKFEVTPATTVEPVLGFPSHSAQAVISQNVKTTITSSGGRGGGGGSPVIYNTPAPTQTEQPKESGIVAFNDIATHWAKDDINLMYKKEIVKGIDTNTFGPDLAITRVQFAAMLIRALQLKTVPYNNLFTDVSKDDWYADAVQTAAQSGVISGNDGLFRPNDVLERQEMAKMIIEAYKLQKNEGLEQAGIEEYSDKNDISDWAVDYIKTSKALGFINGLTETKFAPKATASRAQAVVIIKRLLDKLDKLGGIS